MSSVDVLIQTSKQVDTLSLYQVYAALSKLIPSIHANCAVGIGATPGGIRIRLYQGERCPMWLVYKDSHWVNMSVKDIAPILGKELYVNNSLLVIEDMHVEQTRPCSTLEGMLIHTHNKELTTDKLKDRVEACGVPCVVERVGEELTIRTGHKGLAENTRKAFKVRVHVTKPAHGIVLQSFPLSGGGRYGGGMLVPSDAPSLAVPVGDMLSVRDVAKQLGIDASQACRILRDKLRMAPFESMYQRCINADTMRRIGDAHRDCRKRVEYPHTGKRWTEEQLAVVWDWIQGRCTWKYVSATTGKTMAACKTMRVRMLNQTGGF